MQGADHRLHAVAGAELFGRGIEMQRHRRHRAVQLAGDLFGGKSFGGSRQTFALAVA